MDGSGQSISRMSFLKLAALGAIAPYAAACGGDDDGTPAAGGTGANGGSGDPVPVRLRLDWIPDTRHAPFYIAQEKGYYEEEGVDLEIIAGSGSADSIKFLGTNAVDLAIIEGMASVQARAVGVPVKSIGVWFHENPFVVLSLASNPIETPQELVGKRVGASHASASWLGFLGLLANEGIDQNDLEIVDTGFSVQPLLVGQVDAETGYAIVEPVEVAVAGEEPHSFLMSDYGVVAYGSSVMTTDRYLEREPEALAGFLRATKRGVEEAVANPDEAVRAVVDEVSDADAAVEEIKVQQVIEFFSSDETDEGGFLAQSEAGWQQTVDTAIEIGIVTDADAAPAASEMHTAEVAAAAA